MVRSPCVSLLLATERDHVAAAPVQSQAAGQAPWPALCVAAARRLDADGPVRTECPAGIVGDLPHIAVGIGECPCRAAPLGAGRRPNDGGTCPPGFGQYGADLLGRADVVGELDPGSAVTPERRPQAEDHPAGLEEADLIIGLLGAAPAERLVERPGPGKVGDTERHQADALIHAEIIADAASSSAAVSFLPAGVP